MNTYQYFFTASEAISSTRVGSGSVPPSCV